MPDRDEDLSLDAPWALGERKYEVLRQALAGTDVKQLLEFGSGRSTVRFAEEYAASVVYSVESDRGHGARTAEMLEVRGATNVRLVFAELRWQRFGWRLYRTYDRRTVELPVSALLDFVLVDGPVDAKTGRGREGALHLVYDRLVVGGKVALDDYHRVSAQRAVRNWLATYSGLRIILDDTRLGLAILEKTSNAAGRRWPGIRPVADNYRATVDVMARLARAGLASRIRRNSDRSH